MKRIIYLTLLLLLSNHSLLGQCVNNVSTNPDNPTNNALPDVGSSAPYAYDQRYFNGFNWWSTTSYPLTDMQYNVGQPYDHMLNIQSTAYGLDYSYLIDAPLIGAGKMLPENGWELLLANLGRYPDNVTVNTEISYRQTPYLVFYNRYKGIIRVFVRYGNNTPPSDAVNGVKINLEYFGAQNNNLSGIFRLANGMDQSLDQPTSVSAIGTIAPKPGQVELWFSGDLQVAYDPCVCSYPTNLKLSFEFFSTTDFKLTGRGISIDKDIVDNNGDVVNQDFLSGVDFTATGNADNGFIIYRDMYKLAEDYDSLMTDFKIKLAAVGVHNAEVEKKLAIIKVFKIVVNAGLNAAVGTPSMAALALKAPHLVFGTTAADSTKRKNFFNKVEKMLGEKLNTYISESFKKKPNPDEPSMPTASFSEMNFVGQLSTETPIQGPLFATPGSFVNNDIPNDTKDITVEDVYGYPIYNEALGQFALLEKPKVVIATKHTNFNAFQGAGSVGGSNSGPYDIVSCNKKSSNVIQIKLNNDLKYTFNPVLDVVESNIQASFVIKVKKVLHDSVGSSGFLYAPKNSNLFNANVATDFFNINSSDSIKFDKLEVVTPYVPINGFKNQIASFGIDNHYKWFVPENQINICLNSTFLKGYEYVIESVQLKLLVDMEFGTLRDDGSPNAVTQGFTYDIDLSNDVISQNSLMVNSSSIPAIDNTQYPENSFYSTTYFNGQIVNNCVKSGSLYTCKAQNDITINGDITVANGYHVNFKAGHEINVIGESTISPEAVLEIDFYENPYPMPAVSQSYVSDFCNGLVDSPYQGNRPSSRIMSIIEAEQKELKREKQRLIVSEIQFDMFPNPTTNNTTIVITNLRTDNVNITLKDIMGKDLPLNFEQANSNSYNLDVSHLEAGMYFVTVSSYGVQKTKRLVVQ